MSVGISDYPAVETPVEPDPPPSTELMGQFVSLRALFSAVRRGRRVCLATMALGLVGGLGISIFAPSSYSATTKLFLSRSGAQDPVDAMATDVALLQTQGVAQRVVNQLHLQETARQFVNQYSGTSLSNEVLEVTVSAPLASEATTRADALATAFLAYRAEAYTSENKSVVAALDAKARSLAAEANRLSVLLGATGHGTSSTGTAPTNSVALLQSEQTQAVTEEAQILQNVQTDNLNTATQIASSSVLAPAVLKSHSHLRKAVTSALTGLLVGLAFGVFGLALSATVSGRVRRREDVAASLGAPVELNLGRIGNPRWFAIPRLQRQLRRPPPEAMVLARHLRAKMAGGQSSLAVVSIDSVEAASLAAALCVRELTSDGKEVLVIDSTPNGLLSKLFGVSDKPSAPAESSSGNDVRVYDPISDGQIQPHPPVGACVLVLATLDPVVGAEHIVPWAKEAVILVTAGRSDAEKIHMNGELLRAAGVRVDSAVLIEADRDDYSLGRRSWSSATESDPGPRPIAVEPARTPAQR